MLYTKGSAKSLMQQFNHMMGLVDLLIIIPRVGHIYIYAFTLMSLIIR